jgi:hypothetical protein
MVFHSEYPALIPIMTTRLFLSIIEHPFLQEGGCDFMQLGMCKKPYQIIEKILLNVSAKNSIKWAQLIKTEPTDYDLYPELCVAVILMDKYLYDLFNMSEADRYTLIGYKFARMIDEFKETLSKK